MVFAHLHSGTASGFLDALWSSPEQVSSTTSSRSFSTFATMPPRRVRVSIRTRETSFYDVPGPEQDMDWRPPIFDPQLKYFIDLARNNFEKVTMARKSAQMAAHIANLASTAAIVKSHQLVYDIKHQSIRPEKETLDSVALDELDATRRCADTGYCSPTPAQAKMWDKFLDARGSHAEEPEINADTISVPGGAEDAEAGGGADEASAPEPVGEEQVVQV
ncbi:unnamed protein product [Amoebophrya sp. A120]|nr:unnamed protein product [Amoebophrya sp. A120]|eukprot:GSA120T00005136001.1